MMTICSRKFPTVREAVSPAAPRKKMVEVLMATYSDSNPMMDGVMMRLFVTVWNATVAVA